MAILGVLGFLLGGCGTDFKLSGIQVAILEAKQAAPAQAGKEVVLVLRYANENVVPLAAASTTHKLYLNGTYVGRSISDQPVGLPQLGVTSQATTFRIENTALFGKLVAAAQSQTAAYKLESRIKIQSGEEENEVKTQSQGSVDLKPLMP